MSEFRDKIQKEAVKIALESDRCGLDISVRLGKTFIGLTLASYFNKVLVSYPSISIKQSWLSDADKFEIDISNYTFTTHISLNKHDLNQFDCIILDEVDQVSETQWNYIELSNPKVIKALSGTFPISGIKKQYIDKFCPIKYSVKLDETTGKTSKDYEIVVHLLEPSIIFDIPLSSGKKWSEKAKIQYWDNKYNSSRNFLDMLKLIQAIQNSKTKLEYLKKLANKVNRCLIFLETTEQCKQLKYPSYNSSNKPELNDINLGMFDTGDSNKLTCVKQISAGITFNNLNECIILHAYASNSKFHQRMARCLQYSNGEKAIIHLLCLNNTRDKNWVESGLKEFNKNKITWKKV